ncbi:MAG: BrnT family toxin [Ignavibacteriales bacterium]|nr:BrnT family toxin [Ignavibacteriales bacterium]
MYLYFDWNEEKANRNWRNHKVSFEEAKTVFNDPLSVTIGDPGHSIQENRYLDIGRSSRGRVLVVVYTEKEKAIRIISSRLATRKEREEYEEGSI